MNEAKNKAIEANAEHLYEILLLFEQRTMRHLLKGETVCDICGVRSSEFASWRHKDHCPLEILDTIRAVSSD